MRPNVARHVIACVSRTLVFAAALAAAPIAFAPTASSQAAIAAEPITIGFAEALTGSLAVVGKSGLLAAQVWAEDVNAEGGLLGRPVKLIYYDHQSNPANVPGIYTKLLDVDHVDLVISPYATNMTAPAMPIAMAHQKVFISVFCLAVNSEFHYPRYFAMLPTGPDPMHAFSQGYFDLAMSETPKPRTIAIVAADAEFSRNASSGARDNAKAAGLRIVYDGTYPPTTTDYTPIVRAVRATNPDLVYVASYPADTAGMLRAVHEVGLDARLFGGNLVGLQTTALKTQLGSLLNGVVVNENWIPAPALQFPGVMDFLARYQAKAPVEGVDPLGWFLPPYAYARLQVLAQAVTATGSLDDAKLADYLHANSFNTFVGTIAFGDAGEWTKSRIIWTQFRGITGHDLAQFKDPATEVVLLPSEYKSGDLVYPYASAAP
jgi:branched-chain amino acid transport system substrate-binding protein